jgi:branched-subunit amino acid aminotransferase/4-amino-4-deoxychorismate lyase
MDTVPADDRGLTLGVGLFETLLVVDGRPAHWAAHLDRMARGCAALGLPPPDLAACAEAADRALAEASLTVGRAALRLTWTGGSGDRGLAAPTVARPRLLATVARIGAPPERVSLATVSVRRNPTSPASRFKTLNYLDSVLARQAAVSAGADEALMLDTEGHLACVAAANLFWLEGERLRTPALGCGVLDGVVRALAITLAPAHGFSVDEVTAPPTRLMTGQGGFTTNSLQGAVRVGSVDGVPLPDGGPKLSALLAAVRAAAERTTSI